MLKQSVMIFCILFFTFTQCSFAFIEEKDYSKFCPDYKSIKFNLTSKWHYVLYAYNAEGKYFISQDQIYDSNNAPALPVFFIKSYYEPIQKKLNCVYYAYHIHNVLPVLANAGDY